MQHLGTLGHTKERLDFPSLAAAFRCISMMRRRLRGKENRVGSKRWGVAPRARTQAPALVGDEMQRNMDLMRELLLELEALPMRLGEVRSIPLDAEEIAVTISTRSTTISHRFVNLDTSMKAAVAQRLALVFAV